MGQPAKIRISQSELDVMDVLWTQNPIGASEVADALASSSAVVALESTIISHGMPYPKNVETALRVEQEVRDHGAVPATMASMHGRLKVGLTEAEIEQLGKAGLSVTKASRRDIPFVVASGQLGATTVAATMILAAQADIKIFATGGLGGVHRGAETSVDVSAGLQELAETAEANMSSVFTGTSLDAIRHMAATGAGVAILPAIYALTEASRDADLVLRRLDHPQAHRRVALVWRKTSPMAQSYEQMADILREDATAILRTDAD